MPLIVSQEELDDGLRITVRGGVINFTSADLPPKVRSMSVADAEAWINAKLADICAERDFYAKVQVFSVVPLKVRLITSDTPIEGYGKSDLNSGAP